MNNNTKIVIPMAGLSSRFTKAGYKIPKYMLEAKGKTVFELSLLSFEKYFRLCEFLFICLDVFETPKFIHDKCKKLGIFNYKVVILETATKGQAETVIKGINAIEESFETGLLIFNIDTFRLGYTFPDDFNLDEIDGYLETFIGSGKNWSNVLPYDKTENKVKLTAEKREISEFCCTGLYYWGSCSLFVNAFNEMKQTPLEKLDAQEYYIAPMYNYIIKAGADVRFTVIPREQIVFCGTPSEYMQVLES
ncbi:capsular biosynthesis protein [Glaciecola sp. 1036]|uniref:capsular biosynthesis protein n=1 Tax=Alteromonadaceae TaxID=72275 RepID=UPI003CFCA7D1